MWPFLGRSDGATKGAELADRFDLCGYDSVLCASGVILADDDVVAAAGNRRLLGAWVALGLAAYDSNQRLGE